jgi:rod shape-determining protein MreD
VTGLLSCLALLLTALLLQTVFLPPFFPAGMKPDLVLLLTIWLGLRESPWRGGWLVYAIGSVYDLFAGTFPGLHGFVLLAIFLLVSGMATRLNTESLPLLWCLVTGGTLLQGLLTVFALEFFADVERFWAVMLAALPGQLVLNLAAAYLLWRAARRWAGRLSPELSGRWRRRHAD